jgi:hypothetical protein
MWYVAENPSFRNTFLDKEKLGSVMVLSPPIVGPKNSIATSISNGWTNELACFIHPYRIVAYSTLPIPPMGTDIPQGLMPNSYFNKCSVPSRVPHIEPGPTPINSYDDCLTIIREVFKKQMRREAFGIELPKKSRVYQKTYPSYCDSVAYLIAWHILDFMKYNGGRC